MKNLDEILNQQPVFLHSFSDEENVRSEFEETEIPKVLFASYGQDNYSGDAFVLCLKDGKLFESHGSHCSCYGLEGQFDLEETTLESLHHRLTIGDFGNDTWSGNQFRNELKDFLGIN